MNADISVDMGMGVGMDMGMGMGAGMGAGIGAGMGACMGAGMTAFGGIGKGMWQDATTFYPVGRKFDSDQQANVPECGDWKRGNCFRGESCKYLHLAAPEKDT